MIKSTEKNRVVSSNNRTDRSNIRFSVLNDFLASLSTFKEIVDDGQCGEHELISSFAKEYIDTCNVAFAIDPSVDIFSHEAFILPWLIVAQTNEGVFTRFKKMFGNSISEGYTLDQLRTMFLPVLKKCTKDSAQIVLDMLFRNKDAQAAMMLAVNAQFLSNESNDKGAVAADHVVQKTKLEKAFKDIMQMGGFVAYSVEELLKVLERIDLAKNRLEEAKQFVIYADSNMIEKFLQSISEILNELTDNKEVSDKKDAVTLINYMCDTLIERLEKAKKYIAFALNFRKKQGGELTNGMPIIRIIIDDLIKDGVLTQKIYDDGIKALPLNIRKVADRILPNNKNFGELKIENILKVRKEELEEFKTYKEEKIQQIITEGIEKDLKKYFISESDRISNDAQQAQVGGNDARTAELPRKQLAFKNQWNYLAQVVEEFWNGNNSNNLNEVRRYLVEEKEEIVKKLSEIKFQLNHEETTTEQDLTLKNEVSKLEQRKEEVELQLSFPELFKRTLFKYFLDKNKNFANEKLNGLSSDILDNQITLEELYTSKKFCEIDQKIAEIDKQISIFKKEIQLNELATKMNGLVGGAVVSDEEDEEIKERREKIKDLEEEKKDLEEEKKNREPLITELTKLHLMSKWLTNSYAETAKEKIDGYLDEIDQQDLERLPEISFASKDTIAGKEAIQKILADSEIERLVNIQAIAVLTEDEKLNKAIQNLDTEKEILFFCKTIICGYVKGHFNERLGSDRKTRLKLIRLIFDVEVDSKGKSIKKINFSKEKLEKLQREKKIGYGVNGLLSATGMFCNKLNEEKSKRWNRFASTTSDCANGLRAIVVLLFGQYCLLTEEIISGLRDRIDNVTKLLLGANKKLGEAKPLFDNARGLLNELEKVLRADELDIALLKKVFVELERNNNLNIETLQESQNVVKGGLEQAQQILDEKQDELKGLREQIKEQNEQIEAITDKFVKSDQVLTAAHGYLKKRVKTITEDTKWFSEKSEVFANLLNNVHELNTEIEKLEEGIKLQKQELDEIKLSSNGLKAQQKTVMARIKESQQKLEDTKNLILTREEKQEIMSRIAQSRKQFDDISNKLAANSEEIDKIKNNIGEKTKELTVKAGSFTKINDEHNEVAEIYNEMQEKLTRLKKEKTSVLSILDKMSEYISKDKQENINGLLGKVDKLELPKLAEEIEKTQAKLKTRNEDNNELLIQCATISGEMIAAKVNAELSMSEVAEQLKKVIESDVNNWKQEVAQVQEQITEFDKEISAFCKKRDELRIAVEKGISKNAEMDSSLKAEVVAIETNLSTIEINVKEAEGVLQEIQKTFNRYFDELKAEDVSGDRKVKLRTEIDKINKTIAKENTKLEKLGASKEIYNKQSNEIKQKLTNESTRKQKILNEYKAQLEELNNDIEEIKGIKTNVQEVLIKVTSDKENVSDTLNSVKSFFASDTFNQLNNKLQIADSLKQPELPKLDSKFLEKYTDASDVNRAKADAKSQSIQVSLASANGIIKEMKDLALTEANFQVIQIQNQYNKLSNQYNKLSDKIEGIKSEIEEFRSSVLLTRKDRLSKIGILTNGVKMMEEKLGKLCAEIEELRQKMKRNIVTQNDDAKKVEEKRGEFTKLNKKSIVLNTQREALCETIDNYKIELEKIKNEHNLENETTSKNIRDYTTQISNLVKIKENMKESILALNILSIKQEVDSYLSDSNHSLNTTLSGLNSKVVDMTTQIEQPNTTLMTLQQTLNSLDNLKETGKENSEACEKITKELAEVSRTLETAISNIENSNEIITKSSEEIAAFVKTTEEIVEQMKARKERSLEIVVELDMTITKLGNIFTEVDKYIKAAKVQLKMAKQDLLSLDETNRLNALREVVNGYLVNNLEKSARNKGDELNALKDAYVSKPRGSQDRKNTWESIMETMDKSRGSNPISKFFRKLFGIKTTTRKKFEIELKELKKTKKQNKSSSTKNIVTGLNVDSFASNNVVFCFHDLAKRLNGIIFRANNLVRLNSTINTINNEVKSSLFTLLTESIESLLEGNPKTTDEVEALTKLQNVIKNVTKKIAEVCSKVQEGRNKAIEYLAKVENAEQQSQDNVGKKLRDKVFDIDAIDAIDAKICGKERAFKSSYIELATALNCCNKKLETGAVNKEEEKRVVDKTKEVIGRAFESIDKALKFQLSEKEYSKYERELKQPDDSLVNEEGGEYHFVAAS